MSHLDFDALPVLIGPRRRSQLAQPYERERLAFKAKRKHPKRHNENKERAFRDREKARRAAVMQAKRVVEVRAYKAQVRAYWQGERDDHPTL